MCRKNYIFLTFIMALADFKIKYDNSVLGYFWSLLKPLLMFGTLYLVFSVLIKWEVENHALYLLLGIILWNFPSEVTLNSMILLEGKSSILKKIYLPLFPHAIQKFDLSGYDCALSFSHCVAKGVKVPEDILHTYYCHTPMRYAWYRRDSYLRVLNAPKRMLAESVLKPSQKLGYKSVI